MHSFSSLGILYKNVKVYFLYLVSNSNRDDEKEDNRNVSVIHFTVFKGK